MACASLRVHFGPAPKLRLAAISTIEIFPDRHILALTDKYTPTSRLGIFAFEGLATIIERRSWIELAFYLTFAIVCLGIAGFAAILLYPIDTLGVGPVENGWYESAQTLVLAVTILVLLHLLLTATHEIFYFFASLAIFLPLALVRETPRCGSPFYDGGPCLSSDSKVLAVGLAIAMVITILSVRRVPWARSWHELTFFYAVPMALTGLMLIGSEIFGKHIYVWAEETLELAAYLNLLGLALALRIHPDWFVVSDTEPTAA